MNTTSYSYHVLSTYNNNLLRGMKGESASLAHSRPASKYKNITMKKLVLVCSRRLPARRNFFVPSASNSIVTDIADSDRLEAGKEKTRKSDISSHIAPR